MNKIKGSDKLLASWKARTISEEALKEIGAALDKSPALVEEVAVVGGVNPTSVHLSLSYTGDDVPLCGNDLTFWLHWHRQHGGVIRPPKILINGIPFPDLVKMQLEFAKGPVAVQEVRELGADLRRIGG